MNYTGSTGRETEQYWYCCCMTSTITFQNSSCRYNNTSAQTPNVNIRPQIMPVWHCTPQPDAPATQVEWKPECFAALGQWRSQYSPLPTDGFWNSKNILEGNTLHKIPLHNIIQWDVLDGWRRLNTGHYSSRFSAGFSTFFCRYTICALIAHWFISPYWTTLMRCCKSSIQPNAPSIRPTILTTPHNIHR